MKTNYVPAIVMLLAGGVYCLFGIYNQTPLMDFCLQLLAVLIIFWIIGGIIRMVLDRFIGEMEDKTKNEEDSDGDRADSKGAEDESLENEGDNDLEE